MILQNIDQLWEDSPGTTCYTCIKSYLNISMGQEFDIVCICLQNVELLGSSCQKGWMLWDFYAYREIDKRLYRFIRYISSLPTRLRV